MSLRDYLKELRGNPSHKQKYFRALDMSKTIEAKVHKIRKKKERKKKRKTIEGGD